MRSALAVLRAKSVAHTITASDTDTWATTSPRRRRCCETVVPAAAGLERLRRVCPRAVERRHHGRRDRRRQGERESKAEDAPVGSDVPAEWDVGGDMQRGQAVGHPARQRHRPQRSGEREQHALDDELAAQSPPARAERRANGQLPVARGRANEKEIDDIRADDEQDERDERHECRDRGGHGARDREGGTRVRLAHEHGVHATILDGVVVRELPRLRAHRGARLRHRNPSRETPERDDEALTAVPHRAVVAGPDLIERRVRVDLQDRIDAMKTLRRDADDRRSVSGNANGVADDVAVAAIFATPEGVAQDDHRMSERALVLVEAEETPDVRAESQHREVVRRDVVDPEPLGVVPFRRRVEGAGVVDVRGEPTEDRAIAGVVVVVRVRELVRHVDVRVDLAEHHQLAARGYGKGSKQKRAGEAEHGAIDADAEGEGDRDDDGEPRRLRERAQGEANVTAEIAERCRGARTADVLLVDGPDRLARALHVSELAYRLRPRRFGSDPFLDELLRPRVEVKAKLVVHVRGDVGSPEAEVAVDGAVRISHGGAP